MSTVTSIIQDQASGLKITGIPVPHSERVYCVAFSPDGRFLVSGSVNRQVNLWKIGETELADYLKGHTKFVWSLAFAPDGKTLVSTSGDGNLFFWDLERRTHYRIEESHYSIVYPLYDVACSPDGQYVAAGCSDGLVRLWSTSSRRPPWKLKGHTSEVYSVAFSPDGKRLASGGNDATIRYWDLEDKREIEILSRPGSRVSSLAFSGDGRFLASASTDAGIYLVDLKDNHSRVLTGHHGVVWSIAFSPDSRLLISGGNDHSVRLWDVASGELIRILEGHLDEVNGVAFSPDGRHAASASNDRTVRLWDLTLLNERPETYLKLIRGKRRELVFGNELLAFLRTHRASLEQAYLETEFTSHAVRRLRPLLERKNPPPLGLVHDLGRALFGPGEIPVPDPENDTPYTRFLYRLGSRRRRGAEQCKLNDFETGLLLGWLLRDIDFPAAGRAPAGHSRLQLTRLLETVLSRPEKKKAAPPLLRPQDQAVIDQRLKTLEGPGLRLLLDLLLEEEADPEGESEKLALLPEHLPPQLPELYAQLLNLAPRLLSDDHRGSQDYSCGGYLGLTHKGQLDSLALSEHLYPAKLLRHRILNREALYYGREGEAEKQRRLTLVITQAGFELAGSGRQLARALTLASRKLLSGHAGELRQTFFGADWIPPTDLRPALAVRRIINFEEPHGLEAKSCSPRYVSRRASGAAIFNSWSSSGSSRRISGTSSKTMVRYRT
ncbi:MAG: WD40 repeat domain-containing protein [Deltaproteobacteria bacterium]|nr:WD40 repeat domain-containing protein [Deltaproteobacteria bacterium]